jgi:hypothetical protein
MRHTLKESHFKKARCIRAKKNDSDPKIPPLEDYYSKRASPKSSESTGYQNSDSQFDQNDAGTCTIVPQAIGCKLTPR